MVFLSTNFLRVTGFFYLWSLNREKSLLLSGLSRSLNGCMSVDLLHRSPFLSPEDRGSDHEKVVMWSIVSTLITWVSSPQEFLTRDPVAVVVGDPYTMFTSKPPSRGLTI